MVYSILKCFSKISRVANRENIINFLISMFICELMNANGMWPILLRSVENFKLSYHFSKTKHDPPEVDGECECECNNAHPRYEFSDSQGFLVAFPLLILPTRELIMRIPSLVDESFASYFNVLNIYKGNEGRDIKGFRSGTEIQLSPLCQVTNPLAFT